MSTAWTKEAILGLMSVIVAFAGILLSVFILLGNRSIASLRRERGTYHMIPSPVDGSERDIELAQIEPAPSTAALSVLKPVTTDQILGIDKRSQLEGLHGHVPRDLTVALGGRLSNLADHGAVTAHRTINPWVLEKEPNPVLFPYLRNGTASMPSLTVSPVSGPSGMSGSSNEAAHASSNYMRGQLENTNQGSPKGPRKSAEDSVRSSSRGQRSIHDYFPVVRRPHVLQPSAVSPTRSYDQTAFMASTDIPSLCESTDTLSDGVDSMDLATPRTRASSTSSETNLIVYSPTANDTCHDDSRQFWDDSLQKPSSGFPAVNRKGKQRAIDEMALQHVIPASFVCQASIDTSTKQRIESANMDSIRTSHTLDNSQPSTDTDHATVGTATCVVPTTFSCTQCERVLPNQGKLNDHVNRKHVRRYPWYLCPYRCNLRADLTRHLNTKHKDVHLSTHSYRCTINGCETTWVRKDHLKRHMLQQEEGKNQGMIAAP